jgi:naphthalene 1,2-dioxygenase system ferredoxin subunit
MAENDSGEWVAVADQGSIGDGEMKGVTVGSQEVALYNVKGEIYATDNLCSHAYAFLTDGWMDGEEVECPLHAGRFEIKTGKGLGPPIPCDVKSFPVRIEGDKIQVKLGG